MKKGFTLTEMLIVVIIIGVLATLALTQYGRHREGVLDKEASANLKLIQSAQRIYKMEFGFYADCGNTSTGEESDINDQLRLLLPTDANRKWAYKITDWTHVVSPPSDTFTAKAQRQGSDSRVWCINQATDEPYSTGCTW